MFALADKFGVPIQEILDMDYVHFVGHMAAASVLKKLADRNAKKHGNNPRHLRTPRG